MTPQKKNKKSSRYNHYLIAIILITSISTMVYINTLRNGFTYDDRKVVVKNEEIKDLKNFFDLLLPLPSVRAITLMIDYHIFGGLNSVGFHLTNVILHTVTVILLYFLLNLIFKDYKLSLIIGLLFATHPVHTEAVANITNRKESLAMIFYLLTFIFYLKKDKSRWFLFSSFITYFLSLSSKPVAPVAFPVMLFIYDNCFSQGSKLAMMKKNIKYYLSYGIIMILYFIWTLKTRESSGAGYTTTIIHISQNITDSYLPILYTSLVSLMKYIRLLILPYNLCADYYTPIQMSLLKIPVLLSIGVLISITIVTIKIYRYSKEIFLGILWFFVNWLPISNLMPLTTFFVAERYIYLPSVGFCIILGVIIHKIGLRYKRLAMSLLVVLLAVYSILAINRNCDWESETTLWASTIKQNPKSLNGFFNLGIAYANEGLYEKALAQYKKVFEMLKEIRDLHTTQTNYNYWWNWWDEEVTKAYREAKDRYNEKMIKDYEEELKRDPSNIKLLHNLGLAYRKKGDDEKALAKFNEVLLLDPNCDTAHYYLGAIYKAKKDYQKAIEEYNQAVRLNPGEPESYYHLAWLYYKLGRYKEAKKEINEALSLEANNKKYLQLLSLLK